MLLPRFTYHRPASLAEALAILAEHQGQAAVLAGGTDLLVGMKHKLLKPAHVVGLEVLEGLNQVEEQEDALLIGPMLTAAVLFWLARGDQEAFETVFAARPQLHLLFSARSELAPARVAA